MAIAQSFFKRAALAVVVAALAAGSASAGVITFEDAYPGYDTAADLDPDYDGFSWSGSPSFVTSQAFPGGGMEHGTIDLVSLLAIDGIVSFSRATHFNLDSAFITSAWNTDEQVTVQGLRNGQLVYSTMVLASTDANEFAFHFSDIDSVSIIGVGGVNVGGQNGEGPNLVIDNIGVSELSSDPVPVPEPDGSALLLIGGLALLAARRFKAS